MMTCDYDGYCCTEATATITYTGDGTMIYHSMFYYKKEPAEILVREDPNWEVDCFPIRCARQVLRDRPIQLASSYG